jgi:hypothetical protein
MFDAIEPTAAPVRHRGMASRYQSITAATASTAAASSRLFGYQPGIPNNQSTRGEMLRFVLCALYGADYRKRGARLLGVDLSSLSRMLTGRKGVSRRVVDRLQDKLVDRMRHRRGEVRDLGAMVAAAFEAHDAAIEACPGIVAMMARAASEARFNRQPHSSETGRFVPRRQGKAPLISEVPRAAKKRGKER